MTDPELESLRKQCITKLYLCTNNIFKYLDKEQEEEIANLKSCLERYCLHEAEQNVLRDVAEKVKNESDASNIDTIEERFSSYMKHLSKKVKVKNHPSMVELEKIIKKGKEERENDLDESDLAITNTNEVFIDPITKKPIEDPVRNTLCGHIYERESIITLIKSRKKKTLCPVVGCGSKEPLQENYLIPDEEMRLRLTQLTSNNNIADNNIVVSMDFD